jgi:hypothetical protein
VDLELEEAFGKDDFLKVFFTERVKSKYCEDEEYRECMARDGKN